ncbi:transglycosylase SLT domain-containing protein [Xanthomonas campestris pv. campestris]|nr:transglycosylase SLT domain-containing protein [Xanthomonas campestris pv. campestris]MEB1789608.1 transglycosylase SLT domain-containing protein [Xanthomonas campestris pv. campestris]MEB1844489.1 transglycosylase SLT domain-containing protein [Xanthomonas campestris pv. campestris]MEB1878250.1 transglycosylase SLT domain-containing protein [Xanthomonas campestris pv. campestris]
MNWRISKRLPAVILYAIVVSQPAMANVEVPSPQQPTDYTQLVTSCAPMVHPNTMQKLIGHESAHQPYIIGVNEKGKPRQVFRLNTQQEAVEKAKSLIAEGKSIDMGLGQIWSGNLKGLNLTLEQVFDPCTNVRVAAQLLTQAYDRAVKVAKNEAEALDQALSVYNTGRFDAGISNGYVSKVRGTPYKVPALDAGAGEAAQPPAVLQAQPEGPPPAWDVFANARYRGPRESTAQPTPADEAQPQAASTTAPVMLFSEPR